MTEKIDENFYNQATQNILAKIRLLGMSAEDTEKAIKLATLFRAAFKLNTVKKKSFKTKDSPLYKLGYHSGGFCRIASTVFMAAMGAADWELMCIDGDKWVMSHHYLKYRPNGKILDLTYDQFAVKGLSIPYELGHPAEDACATISANDGDGLKFAESIGIDIREMLKENSRRGK